MGTEIDGKKVEVIGRIDRLRELVEQDAPAILLEVAFNEIGRSLDGLMRPGRSEGLSNTQAGLGEPPPAL